MARFDACRVSAVAVLVFAGVVSGCGSHPTAYCAALRRSSAGFNDGASAKDAVAALDRLLAQLPAADRPDLRVLRDYVEVVSFPKEHPGQAVAAIEHLAAAAPRIDRRLQRECGVSMGKLQTFFARSPIVTTTTRPTTTEGKHP